MAFSEVGTPASDFSLFNQRGEKVSLADFRGVKNVLLYFYPKAMTPGCTIQACGIRDSKDQFAELDTVVMAVSPDSVDRLVKFEDKQELNFTLLSDEDHQVTERVLICALPSFSFPEFIACPTMLLSSAGTIFSTILRIAHCMWLVPSTKSWRTSSCHCSTNDCARPT